MACFAAMWLVGWLAVRLAKSIAGVCARVRLAGIITLCPLISIAITAAHSLIALLAGTSTSHLIAGLTAWPAIMEALRYISWTITLAGLISHCWTGWPLTGWTYCNKSSWHGGTSHHITGTIAAGGTYGLTAH